jgi:hypothetical protein
LREVELFVEHLGPVVGTPNMPFGRLAWLTAMDAEGLLTKSVVELQVEHADVMLGKEWRSGSPDFDAKLAVIIQFAREQFARKMAHQCQELPSVETR